MQLWKRVFVLNMLVLLVIGCSKNGSTNGSAPQAAVRRNMPTRGRSILIGSDSRPLASALRGMGAHWSPGTDDAPQYLVGSVWCNSYELKLPPPTTGQARSLEAWNCSLRDRLALNAGLIDDSIHAATLATTLTNVPNTYHAGDRYHQVVHVSVLTCLENGESCSIYE